MIHIFCCLLKKSRFSEKKNRPSFDCYINKVITYQECSSVWWYSLDLSKILEPELSYCHCYYSFWFFCSFLFLWWNKRCLISKDWKCGPYKFFQVSLFLKPGKKLSSLYLNYTFLIFATPSFLYYQKYRNKLT